MNVIADRESAARDAVVVLYSDGEVLYAAPHQNPRKDGLAHHAAPVSALAAHLSGILCEYARACCAAGNGAALAPLQRRFEIMAQTNPAAKAVTCDGRVLTYGELDEQADALALQLQRDGLLPGSFCVISLAPSLALARATLAILKAGAACLAFDPALPKEYIGAVLEVFRPAFLFVRGSDCSAPANGAMRTIGCDEDAAPLPLGWPDEYPVLAGTPAHVLATVTDRGALCIKVCTHQVLGACLDPIRGEGALAAADPASFWRPLSAGALLAIAPPA